MKKIFETKNLRERVLEILKKAIADGELGYGERLVEREIAERLGVSRTPVREAFRQLEADGLVESLSNGGVMITRFSHEDVRQLYAIRANLEGLAVEWCLGRMTAKDFRQLEAAIAAMEEEGDKGNFKKAAKYNTKFHDTIMQISQSSILASLIESLKNRMQHVITHTLTADIQRHKESAEEHRRIFEAMRNKDKEKAVSAMQEHLLSALDVTLKNLRIPDNVSE